MFDNFNFEIAKIFKKAEDEMAELRHPYVGSEHLLLAILSCGDNVSKSLNKNGLTYQKFRDELVRLVGIGTKTSDLKLYTPLLKRVIDNALCDSKEDSSSQVSTTHLLIALLEESEGIAIRIMAGLEIDLNKLYKDIKKQKSSKSNKLTIYEIGSVLNKYVDLNESVVGREKELDFIIETLLRKNKNNPLLVGKSGTGKTAIVEELARRIEKDEVPEELKNKKIVLLDMASLVSGTKYRGEFEERLNKIIEEVIIEENIILFIDEIHTLVNAGGAEGAIDASNILKPYLARGKIKCIGATTTEEFNKFIAKDKALERRFQKISVFEPTEDETKTVLKAIKKEYEKHYNIKITSKNIDDIVYYANKYIYNRHNPDKCIDVLDSVCAKVKLLYQREAESSTLKERLRKTLNTKKQCVIKQDYDKALKYKKLELDLKKMLDNNKKEIHISKKDILQMIENKTNIPLLKNKRDLFSKLKKDLQYNIVGQKKAIEEILNTCKMYINKSNNKPSSALLFGPTGVGKTYTVKIIAQSLNVNLIRLDMSEYNLDTAVNKLIGVSAGYVGYEDDYIFKDLIDNPCSIILVDEIEKANPKVLNLFLQILDEGYITASNNEKIKFNNALIFMTSNAQVNCSIGFSNVQSDNDYLSREILSRIDNIIKYDSINEKTAKEYLRFKNIKQEEVLSISDYHKYGFRELDRCIKAVSK